MRLALCRQPYADSPTLRDFLTDVLSDPATEEVAIVVAWAKRSGLAPIESALAAFQSRGGHAQIILGIDQGGATRQGLELAVRMFGEAYVFHDPFAGTFHPKLYWAKQRDSARLLVGSNNLTGGGLQSNYETALMCFLDMSQPEDFELIKGVDAHLRRLIDDEAVCLTLNEDLVRRLCADVRHGIGDEDQLQSAQLLSASRIARDATSVQSAPIFGRSREPKARQRLAASTVAANKQRPAERQAESDTPPKVSEVGVRTLHLPSRIVDILQQIVDLSPLELLAFRPGWLPRSRNHTDVLVILREQAEQRALDKALESYDLSGLQAVDGHGLQILACTEHHLRRRLSGGDTTVRDALQDGTRLYPGHGRTRYSGLIARWSPQRAAARWMAVAEQLVLAMRTKRHQIPASHPLAEYFDREMSPQALARTAQECLFASAFVLAYLRGEEPESGISRTRLLEMAQMPPETAHLQRDATAGVDHDALLKAVSEAHRWADAARAEMEQTTAHLPHLGHRAVEAQLLRIHMLRPKEPRQRRRT